MCLCPPIPAKSITCPQRSMEMKQGDDGITLWPYPREDCGSWTSGIFGFASLVIFILLCIYVPSIEYGLVGLLAILCLCCSASCAGWTTVVFDHNTKTIHFKVRLQFNNKISSQITQLLYCRNPIGAVCGLRSLSWDLSSTSKNVN